MPIGIKLAAITSGMLLAGGLGVALAAPASAVAARPAAAAAPTATARPAAAVTSLTEALLARTRAAPATSVPICGGTSLVVGNPPGPGDATVYIRVPTVGNGTPSKWGCDLFPSNVAGLVPVERLQIDLNDCYLANLAVDGEYGPATTAVIRNIQTGEGVTADGDYGPVTIRGTPAGGSFYYQESGEPDHACTFIKGLNP